MSVSIIQPYCNDHCYPENDCTVNKTVLCNSQGETSLLLRFQKEVRNTRPLRTYLCEKVENGHFLIKGGAYCPLRTSF